MPYPALGGDVVRHVPHRAGRPFQHCDLQAAPRVQVDMHGGDHQVVVAVELVGQAVGQVAPGMVIHMDQRRHAGLVGHRAVQLAQAAAVLATPAILRAGPAAAAGMLNVTAYDGFVLPAFRQRFEAETGIQLRIRLAASQAPELSLLVTERDRPLTGICTVTGNRLHQFTEAGIIEPLDTARLRHWDRIDPIYADADWNRVGGATMGVPLVVGANALVFDTAEVTPAPDS